MNTYTVHWETRWSNEENKWRVRNITREEESKNKSQKRRQVRARKFVTLRREFKSEGATLHKFITP